MAISLIASYQLKSSAQGTTPLVTPSFTPSNGEVVTVTWETFDPAITMTITNSGSQTIAQKVLEQPGGFNGTAGINAGTIAGSPGSMTITGTPSASARYSMTVERWSGAQLAATPVTNAATGTTGAAQSTITPTAAGSIISWVAQDSQSVDPSARTYAGSGTDDGVRDDHLGSNGVGYHGYQTSTGATSQTYGLTAPTGLKWVICAIEVQASAGVTASTPPFATTRRRIQAPRRRVTGRSAIKTQIIIVTPPVPPQPIRQGKQLRGLLLRRGRVAAVTPPQVVIAAPAYSPSFIRERIKALLRPLKRGATVIPGQPIPVVPAYVPPPGRLARRMLALRRGTSTAAPSVQRVPPVSVRRMGSKFLPKLFRRPTAQTPPGQIIVQPAAYVPPAAARGRGRALSARPRLTQAPIAQQAAPVPPAYVPPGVRIRVRLLRLARGRTSSVVPAQQAAPVAPAYVPPSARLRGRLLAAARARLTQTPIGQGNPPSPGRSRPRFGRLFRGRQAVTPAQQVAPVAPAYVPPPVHRARAGLPSRVHRGASVVPPQVAPTPPPPYVAPFTRAVRRGLKLLRPRIAQVPANGQAAPPIPPPPPPPPPAIPPPNGWMGLLQILKSAREDLREQEQRREVACPNDGEPLRLSADGFLFCEYDGWTPEDQVIGMRTLGGDWGGLRGILRDVRIETEQDKIRRVIACPNDGEPLSVAQDGTVFCAFDGWILPGSGPSAGLGL